MNNSKIKQKMKGYRDFFGGDLISLDEIDGAKTKTDLKALLYKHSVHIEIMEADAQSHLRNFQMTLGLDNVC